MARLRTVRHSCICLAGIKASAPASTEAAACRVKIWFGRDPENRIAVQRMQLPRLGIGKPTSSGLLVLLACSAAQYLYQRIVPKV
jgi:hypothetical protein